MLPTVLIGVISIAFDEATRQIKSERKEEKMIQETLSRVRGLDRDSNIITDETVEGLRTLFKLIDFDKGGDLCQDELIPFLDRTCKRYNIEASPDTLVAMYQVVDVSNDGYVDFTEVGRRATSRDVARCARRSRGLVVGVGPSSLRGPPNSFVRSPPSAPTPLRFVWSGGFVRSRPPPPQRV